jgi:hypothetical protein
MVFDIERREAADPKFPGVAVETPERLEVVARLWELPEFRHPTQQAFAYMGFRSREDVVMRVGNDPLAQMYYLGEYRKGEQLIEAATATLFERGQLALAALYLSHTARLQLQFGDLGSGMSTFARVLELDERLGHPAAVRTWIGTML